MTRKSSLNKGGGGKFFKPAVCFFSGVPRFARDPCLFFAGLQYTALKMP